MNYESEQVLIVSAHGCDCRRWRRRLQLVAKSPNETVSVTCTLHRRVVNGAYFIVFLFWFFFSSLQLISSFFLRLSQVVSVDFCITFKIHMVLTESLYFILLLLPPSSSYFGDGVAIISTHCARGLHQPAICVISHFLLVFFHFFFSLFVSLPFGFTFVHSFHCTTCNHIVFTLFNRTLLRKV